MARGRDSKGRFTKKSSGRGGGGRSKARRALPAGGSSSTALVRAAPTQVRVVRVNAGPPAKKRKGGGKVVRYVSGDDRALDRGIVEALKREMWGLGGSAVYGYVTQSGAENANTVKEYLDKVPTLDSIGKPASHGLLALFVATKTKRGGWARKLSAAIAKGALYRATYNFGANGFDLEKAAAVGDDELSGEIEVD